MKSQEKIQCKICERKFNGFRHLSLHLRTHKITSKEYYDKYLKKKNEGICKRCGKDTNYWKITVGYRKYCSYKCLACSEDVRDKAKKTYKEKTGYEYSTQNPDVIEQRKDNYKEKTGYENPAQNPKVKAKKKKTCLEKYDIENPFQNEEIKKKIKQTYIEKYGIDNPMKDPDVIEQRKYNYKEKTGFEHPSQNPEVQTKRIETCIEKYGVENPIQNPEVQIKSRNTCIEKYGVYHPMQDPEIFEKSQKKRFKFKEYIMPSGNIRKVQGYEHLALDILTEYYKEINILTHKGVPTIKYTFDDKERRYFPDIYIPSENLIIEVKSDYTYHYDICKNLAKQQACLNQGYKFEFWIFDGNCKLINNLKL